MKLFPDEVENLHFSAYFREGSDGEWLDEER
ncbi:hypothetical protein GGP73_002806 [Salinibacter ruber]|nr:hypothetical protein [Salinibacter ruber]